MQSFLNKVVFCSVCFFYSTNHLQNVSCYKREKSFYESSKWKLQKMQRSCLIQVFNALQCRCKKNTGRPNRRSQPKLPSFMFQFHSQTNLPPLPSIGRRKHRLAELSITTQILPPQLRWELLTKKPMSPYNISSTRQTRRK